MHIKNMSMSGPHTEQDATAAKLHSPVISPSKPVAHLTGESSADVPSNTIVLNVLPKLLLVKMKAYSQSAGRVIMWFICHF